LVKVRYLLIINDFYNTLVDYLALKEQYGEPFNSGAFAKLNSDVVFLKHDMEELSLYVREVIISKQKKIIILVIVFSVIILFVLFLYLVFFYRSLKESISHIQEAMERLLQGDIRDIEPVFFSKELFLFSLQYRKHLAHLRTKKEIIDKFAQGEYDIEIEKLSAYDQIGNSLEALKSSLLSRQEEIASTHRSEEIQRWITEGLANLGEIIRESQENLDTLYQVALKNLLEYLDSPMGAYYEQVKENDEIILKLRVAYAYDKKRMPQVSYKLAEGFIGTVAAEKQRLLLNKVPDNYIFFETAFGVAKPKALIFVPVINRNNVLGVFEIAKNDQFNEHEIELIERFAEDFGVTVVFVSNAEQNRQKIQNLEHQIQQLLEQQKQYQQKLEQLQEQNRKIKEQYEQYRLSLRTKEQIIMEKVDENFRLREEIKKKEEQIKQIMSDFEKIEQKYKERIEILEKQIENLLEQLEQNKNNKQDDDNDQD
jgi:DNA repair exonuclease SbcCD ATPase subunit